MYHIFFIHSSVSGHLGCFHVLAIVNSAAMNVGVHGSFLIMVFSGYMPRSGIVYLLWINIQVLCTFLNSSFYYKKYSLTLLLQLTIDILFFFLIYLFMAVLGLRFCARTFSSCGKWGPLFIAVRGPLTIAASLVVEHRLQTRRLSSCGSRAQLLRGMWDLPSPGLEPVSPALAGRFSTTAPSGNPRLISFNEKECFSGFLFLFDKVL